MKAAVLEASVKVAGGLLEKLCVLRPKENISKCISILQALIPGYDNTAAVTKPMRSHGACQLDNDHMSENYGAVG